MSLERRMRTGLLSGASVLLLGTGAFAQEVAAEATATTTAAPAPEPAPEAAPAAETEAPAEEAPAAEEAAATPAEEAAAEPVGISFMVFADAFASLQTAQVGSTAPSWRSYDSGFTTAGGGLENRNGFGLAFGGIDASYAGKYLGVTTSLRFGPGVTRFYAQDPVLGGIGAITQAYGTWTPTDKLTIDMGMFGTIFGAEVAESWMNMNYTRGALYYQMQPFWHTGLRAAYQLTEELAVKALVVNDVNQLSTSTNLQAGLQLLYSSGGFSGALGTLQTLGEGTSLGFDRFFDAVLAYEADGFKVLFNGDLNIVDNGPTFYGLSLAAGYQFIPMFGAALRGEFLDLNTDVPDSELITGTLTLDFRPMETDNIVVRWDNRVESAAGANFNGTGQNAFFNGSGGGTDAWFTSTIGFVAQTGGLF